MGPHPAVGPKVVPFSRYAVAIRWGGRPRCPVFVRIASSLQKNQHLHNKKSMFRKKADRQIPKKNTQIQIKIEIQVFLIEPVEAEGGGRARTALLLGVLGL